MHDSAVQFGGLAEQTCLAAAVLEVLCLRRHEIVGIVTEVGSKAGSHFKVGDRAGIGCFVRACQVRAWQFRTSVTDECRTSAGVCYSPNDLS